MGHQVIRLVISFSKPRKFASYSIQSILKPEASVSQTMGRDTQQIAKHLQI